MRFWHVEKSLADNREMARQQDFVCKQNCYCAVLHNFCLLNQDDWNDDDNDDPRDQGHDNNDDDVIMDGGDIQSVLRE